MTGRMDQMKYHDAGKGKTGGSGIDRALSTPYFPRLAYTGAAIVSRRQTRIRIMKVRNSLKSAKQRDKNCRVVRRKGRVYVINKTNPRFKARQG